MNIFFVTIIVSSVTAMLTSMITMKFHLIMLKKWLADFFDKQDLWLHDHFEKLAQKLFR